MRSCNVTIKVAIHSFNKTVSSILIRILLNEKESVFTALLCFGSRKIREAPDSVFWEMTGFPGGSMTKKIFISLIIICISSVDSDLTKGTELGYH